MPLYCFPLPVLAGCAQTPFGPTVQVMPGPHKSFEAFASDGQYCKSYSQSQVAGQAQAVNNQAVGGALLATALGAGLGAALGGGNGAAIGAASAAGLGTGVSADASANAQAGIQAQYDNAYAQCMYTKGNQVGRLGAAARRDAGLRRAGAGVASAEPAGPLRAGRADPAGLFVWRGGWRGGRPDRGRDPLV